MDVSSTSRIFGYLSSIVALSPHIADHIYLFIYLNIFIQGRTFSVYTVLQCVPVNAITIKRRYIMQVIL